MNGHADLVIVTTLKPSRLPMMLNAVSHCTILESPTIAITRSDDVSPNSHSSGLATPLGTWHSGCSSYSGGRSSPAFAGSGRMAVSYYDRGTRFVDVAKDGAMEEVGWIVPAVERLVLGYLDLRLEPTETFLDAYRRLGAEPFKALLYGDQADAA